MPETMTEQRIDAVQLILEVQTPSIVPAWEELSQRQRTIVNLASLGGTTESVAGELKTMQDIIEGERKSLIATYGVPNMAAVVNAAIRHRQLAVEICPAEGIVESLSPLQQKALACIAIGLTNQQIGATFDKNPATFHANKIKPALRKLQASGRTHSVRRSYEVGIFKTPGEA